MIQPHATMERFTDRARKVMALANQEAQRFNHEYVDAEHILLALVRDDKNVATNAMRRMEIDPLVVRREVGQRITPGPDQIIMGRLPHQPGAKLLMEHAVEEAQTLGHSYVGTEHLLIAAARNDGIAGVVLGGMGLTVDAVRGAVKELLGLEETVKSAAVDASFDAFMEAMAVAVDKWRAAKAKR